MSQSSIPVATLGVPRIGPRRELKTALESYWAGKLPETELLQRASALRVAAWARQKAHGVTVIPSNDFSLYDHVLDTSVMVGAIPASYGWSGGKAPLSIYFAMARGARGEAEASCGHAEHAHEAGARAQEMTKWFDTNYHYMVPEFAPGQRFEVASYKPVDEYLEAKSLGFETRPVLLGPVTFLKLGKAKEAGFDPLTLLVHLLPVYIDILRRLSANGAEWVQIDEPCLVLDLDEKTKEALRQAYSTIAHTLPSLKLMLATYFGALGDNLDLALSLPVAGLHVDLVRAPEQLETLSAKAPRGLVLSLGVIDGRNIWRADLPKLADRLKGIVAKRGADHIQIAPSCSLLHTPIDLDQETALDADLKSWLAFSVQKMDELAALSAFLSGDEARAAAAFDASARAAAARKASPKVHDAAVAARLKSVTAAMTRRKNAFATRAEAQRLRFALPRFPTTTIGSFPQTAEVRKARSPTPKADWTIRPTTPSCAKRQRARCAGRRRSASMCWCTANSSATTWCSILASSSPASPSPKTPGCRATVRAACVRRFCSATCHARNR